MSVTIPTRPFANYSMEVTLDNRIYILRFKWNTRFEFWSFDILDRNNNVIVYGIKLLLNFELIRRYARENLPPGAIIAVNITGELSSIGRNDLHESVSLVYITEEELQG